MAGRTDEMVRAFTKCKNAGTPKECQLLSLNLCDTYFCASMGARPPPAIPLHGESIVGKDQIEATAYPHQGANQRALTLAYPPP